MSPPVTVTLKIAEHHAKLNYESYFTFTVFAVLSRLPCLFIGPPSNTVLIFDIKDEKICMFFDVDVDQTSNAVKQLWKLSYLVWIHFIFSWGNQVSPSNTLKSHFGASYKHFTPKNTEPNKMKNKIEKVLCLFITNDGLHRTWRACKMQVTSTKWNENVAVWKPDLTDSLLIGGQPFLCC